MLALGEVQTAFRRALLDGDEDALVALVAADGGHATEQVAIYRNNMHASLTNVLRDTFPVVCRLVDDRFFAYAAHTFLTTQPPQRACLAEYGAGFADFLVTFPPCRALVYLPDVARFEWCMNVAAKAAIGEALPASLAGIAAADAPRLLFALDPSLGFLASPWPVDRIWRLNRAEAVGDDSVDVSAGGVHLEVSRRGQEVVFRALDAATFAFRQSLADGATLEAATAAALDSDAHFDLGGAVADLFHDDIVVAVTLAPEALP
jgi:hypothetical protein